MEQEPVKSVFEQRPRKISKKEGQSGLKESGCGEGENEAQRKVRVGLEGGQRDAAKLQKRAQANVRRDW
jgi:hypothetical protein